MGYLNPLLRLPAGRKMKDLPVEARLALVDLLDEMRRHANDEAEKCWARRKAPMAAYWRAVATYSRHVAHTMRKSLASSSRRLVLVHSRGAEIQETPNPSA